MVETDSSGAPTTQTRDDLAAMAACLAGQPEIVLAYLFGPVARGQAGAHSDLDVAVLLKAGRETGQSLEDQLRLMGELERYTSRDVQVLILNQAPPLLAYLVVEEGRLLYERSRAERVNFEVYTRRMYFDFKPRLDFHTRALFKDIQEVGLSGRRKHPGGALEAARRIHERLVKK